MAIKVKHEGSVASRLAASASGGSAKRAMEAAALAKPSQIQTLSPAHASAPSAAAPHAQLISAPGGGAHAQLIHGGGGIGATSRLGGGWGSRSGAATSAQSGGDGEYKVTGSSIFNRPDDASVWDSTTRQWVRRYLPGEKEAEIQQRVGDVKNSQLEDMYEFKLSADQKNELARINKAIEDARKSGRYTDAEMAELERQADAQRLGIKPLPTVKDEPQKPNVQMIDGRPFVQNGNRWDPVEEPKAEKRLTLNDVLRNVPTEKWVQGEKGPEQVALTMDERLDMAQTILDRMYPKPAEAEPNPAVPGTDPLLAARLGFGQLIGPTPANAAALADPLNAQSAAPAPVATQAPATPAPAPTETEVSKAKEEEDEFAAYKRK